MTRQWTDGCFPCLWPWTELRAELLWAAEQRAGAHHGLCDPRPQFRDKHLRHQRQPSCWHSGGCVNTSEECAFSAQSPHFEVLPKCRYCLWKEPWVFFCCSFADNFRELFCAIIFISNAAFYHRCQNNVYFFELSNSLLLNFLYVYVWFLYLAVTSLYCVVGRFRKWTSVSFCFFY